MKFTIEFDKDEFKKLLEALFAPIIAMQFQKQTEEKKANKK